MSLSPALIESVKQHEGLRLKAYQDSEGVWTIGYGTNLQTLEISEQQASAWMLAELERCQQVVEVQTAGLGLSGPQKDALTEMAYNLGPAGLMGFKRMWSHLYAGEHHAAADQALDSKWRTQVGDRAYRLADKLRNG